MNQPDPSSQNSKEPSNRPSPGKGKPERNSPTNLIVVLLMIVLIVYMVSTFMKLGGGDQKLTLSEFMQGLSQEPPIYNAENVHELRFGRMEVTFQDRPAEKSNGIFSTKKPKEKTTYYTLPTYALNDLYPEMVKLLQKRGIKFTSDSGPSEYSQFAGLMILSLITLGLIYIMFRRIGGTGSAMSFSRSRGRMHAQEDLEVTFDSVAGIDEAVEELREVVEFLRTPGKYQALGGRIPRGVLLVGPPGTGKTLLAKAVAGEAKVPFFSLSGSDFVEMFVGVGAARVRDMFAQAAAKAPSIIFIDELDALGKTRGTGMPGGHDERDQTLNALLVEMDGFSSDQSVIVMAATNRPETLDPALMRPGRFDRHVLVDRPDIKGREAILKVHISKVKLSDDVDLKYLARLTPGFVGADLANLVNEAALLAARKNKNVVTMAEFEEGIERVVAGLEKQTRIIPPDEKLRVAYHECGHALVACSLPMTDPVHKISIIPRGFAALGYTLQRPEEERHLLTQTELQNRICVLLGGLAAEELVFKEISSGGQNDLERATDIARRMVMEFGMSRKLGRVNYRPSGRSPFMGTAMVSPADYVHSEETVREIDLETRRIVDEAAKTVRDILTERKAVLEHLSKDLMEREIMDATQLQKILDEHAVPKLKPGTFIEGSEKASDDAGSPPTLRRVGDDPENERTAGA
ncbi:MAG: ATP-dependent zinc metalloprotease FtsH [Planctomycetaceae bacterium]|nr:ATP-dependent zinc metalloprotease FtsH [Planctomycetaceae bacterium]